MPPAQLTTCPKCGAAVQGPSETCNHCGVIFTKVRTGPPEYVPQTPSLAPAEPPPFHSRPCQACGSHGPTTHAVFRQNIGALVMRFSKTLDANLCSKCVKKYFGEFTLITVAVGWLGIVSIVVAPIFVVLNIVNVIQASSALSKASAAAT